jgi:hypothetical protein
LKILKRQTAENVRSVSEEPARVRHELKKSKTGNQFAGFAVRSLLVSGLMASGSMAALSSFGPAADAPRPVRASLAPVFVQAPGQSGKAQNVAPARIASDAAARADVAKAELAKAEVAKVELAKAEAAKVEASRLDAARSADIRLAALKATDAHLAAETLKNESQKTEQARVALAARLVDFAREAALARQELAESAVTVMAATAPASGKGVTGAPDYGFSKLFDSIITAKPDELGLSQDIMKFGPMRVRQDLVGTIVRAAKVTGSDPVLLMAIADKESSFSTSVGASTSSAVGLFQFVEGTWLTVVRQFGARHGLAKEAALLDGSEELSGKDRARILEMRKDPYLSALLASEMLKRDTNDIAAKLGRDLTPEEIYLAHFFGPYDAYKFLDKVDTEPKLVAAKLLPRPARANRPIFYARSGRKSKGLSVGEVHKKIETAMGLRLDRYRDVTNSISNVTAYAPTAAR